MLFILSLIFLFPLPAHAHSPSGPIQKIYAFPHEGREAFLKIMVPDDDLIQLEFNGQHPGDGAIFASQMVEKRDYAGPRHFEETDTGFITGELELSVRASDGCVTVKQQQGELSTFCPKNLHGECGDDDLTQCSGFSVDTTPLKGPDDGQEYRHAYGLGQHFWKLGDADGDWIAIQRESDAPKKTDNPFGNGFVGFYDGASPQLQFPVLYAVGAGMRNYALLFDDVHKHYWDLRRDWWEVRGKGDAVRLYLMTGPDLVDLRKDFMALTGRPPVPPRKMFGLWLSEFGFDDWKEPLGKIPGLRRAGIPVDGFVLDLLWFGGVKKDSPDSPMGGLTWDTAEFPDPKGEISKLREDDLGVIAIEESYVATGWWDKHRQRGWNTDWLVHDCAYGPSSPWINRRDNDKWFGLAGMLDWADQPGARWWHDNLRKPELVDKGVIGHWTDLGEPERYPEKVGDHGCYENPTQGGLLEPGHYRQEDIHNLYNLLWARSIADGYYRDRKARQTMETQPQPRPFILSRAGTVGIQRYGVAMWSGDIAGRLDEAATRQKRTSTIQ